MVRSSVATIETESVERVDGGTIFGAEVLRGRLDDVDVGCGIQIYGGVGPFSPLEGGELQRRVQSVVSTIAKVPGGGVDEEGERAVGRGGGESFDGGGGVTETICLILGEEVGIGQETALVFKQRGDPSIFGEGSRDKGWDRGDGGRLELGREGVEIHQVEVRAGPGVED